MNRELLENKLAAAYDYFKNINHTRNMNHVRHLAQKLTDKKYGIAFAGHFSAGKSRLINSFLGDNILPSSPIPTSANLVKVYKGEDYARVFFSKGKPRKYLAPYDYDLVKSYCRDGDAVSCIELSYSSLHIPEGVEIMDTPGIDSADDAHRMVTEDAIHLADMILYVMDYNHVQSELNFSFTRDLTKAGKEVYLVINQIDKHRENELSFETFKNSVYKAFEGWGVKARGVYFISAKYPDAAHNQYDELMALLEDKIAHRNDNLEDSIYASLNRIITEYIKAVEKDSAARKKEAGALLEGITEDKLQLMRKEYDSLSQEQNILGEDWEDTYKAGIAKILDNAYLMPTYTRDLARDYLEACQPSFKVGFFGRGKKTEAELERRKQIFFDDASEKAKTQIEWHLKTFLLDFVRQHNVNNKELQEKIQSLEILPPEELLTEAMRSGAKLTQDGSYVMNYTLNFAEGIKNVARSKATDIKNIFAGLLNDHRNQRMEVVNYRLKELEEYHRAWNTMDSLDAEMSRLSKELGDMLANGEMVETSDDIADISKVEIPDEEIVAPERALDSENSLNNKGSLNNNADKDSIADGVKAEGEEINSNDLKNEASKQLDIFNASGTEKLKEMSLRLRKGAELIGEIPGVGQMAQELQDRAERLNNKGFLVTLFGAFSAGKSSFANSLLGERLLPVSPNPTTAAINMILPVDEAHPHGTVDIKLKSERMLLDDLLRAFKPFNMSPASLKEAQSLAKEAMNKGGSTHQKEKSFLRAFIAGFEAVESKLGSVFASDLKGFGEYAAQEDKSCFVDWIKVYYNCPLTAKGITLVDTPGADSINARHTNMSFNFIRQSDVVLYVTYYNHAFGKADREFIIQMGRVKDSFQLDKMFFIVNAIDLAEDQDEADHVVNYVRRQLKSYGVAKPQLFALSSQEVLEEREAGNTTPTEFENAFYNFVVKDLNDIALSAARQEFDKAVERISDLINISKSDSAQKELRLAELKDFKEKIGQLLSDLSNTELVKGLEQEASELIYYVKQRVFLRYLDFFRESFNPATLKSGGNSNEQLKEALDQLLESIGFDLAQELRATSLRTDNYIKNSLLKFQEHTNQRLAQISNEFTLSIKEYSYENQLNFQQAFVGVGREKFTKPLSIYKNPKDFFEEGASKIMAEEMEIILSNMADEYLETEKSKLLSQETEALCGLYDKVCQRFNKRLKERLETNIKALDGGLDIAELEQVYNQLLNLSRSNAISRA
ncbi:dynamin family protein [Anaerovibrio sp. RM50]|uniref:dynamin family protein n=1 Tax=Anaerovibrio sp. RM50 TaxID=1200557 RepID=UPI0005679E82|nr:dynamin family protein [Anaerovibrio sp. RM50]